MESTEASALKHHWNFTGCVFGLLLAALPLTVWSALDIENTAPVISEQQAIGLALNRIMASQETITVTNRHHRAVFDRSGVQFMPARGPDWHWQLTQINSARQAAVTPKHSASDTVDFTRAGLIERYLIKADTIEQRFVLDRPWPKGRDLIITGAIASPGKVETTDHGWVWRDASGVVTLGQVTVFDATGNTLPATMAVTTDSSTITIAASDLAGATYPVTIDPEIGSNDFRISDMGPDGNDIFGAVSPVVAYNAIANEYLVVWSGDDEVLDGFEIYGQRIDAATGTEVGTNDFRISDMGPDLNTDLAALTPAVAWNASANEYLVVWSGDDDTGVLDDNGFEIFGQRLNGAGGEVGDNDFRISDMGPVGNTDFDAFTPAVAWNATANEYLVVWSGDDDTGVLDDNGFEIFGQRIDGAGGEVGDNDFRISDMGPVGNTDFDAFTPAVAWNASANQYLVVWSGDDDTGVLDDNGFEIFGQRLNGAGGEVGDNDFQISDMGPDLNTDLAALTPAVAWNATANEYLVVWSGDDDTGVLDDNGFEIFGQRLDGAGGEFGDNDFQISDMGPVLNTDLAALTPAVAWNASANEYLVVWSGDDDTGVLDDNGFEIFGQRLNGAGGEVGDNDFRLSDMGPDVDASFDANSPAVAWNASANEYLVVWSGNDKVLDGFEIFGQLFSAATQAGGGGGGDDDDDDNNFLDDFYGCSLGSNAANDPMLLLFVLLSVICLARRRRGRSGQ